MKLTCISLLLAFFAVGAMGQNNESTKSSNKKGQTTKPDSTYSARIQRPDQAIETPTFRYAPPDSVIHRFRPDTTVFVSPSMRYSHPKQSGVIKTE